MCLKMCPEVALKQDAFRGNWLNDSNYTLNKHWNKCKFFVVHATDRSVLMRSNQCYHFPVASSLLGTLPPPRQPPASDMTLSREHYNCTLPLCRD
jgi:hypothetical protein